jgi:MOSC domain-containing protein YiiM
MADAAGELLSLEELEAGLAHIESAPREAGTVKLIVRRPRSGEREVLDVARLDPDRGLVGDRWLNGSNPQRDEQLTLMSSRVVELLARDLSLWPLAGDQLFVDLDLSVENVPPGTRLAVGSAVIEASPIPHTGCKKFRARFGLDAMRFVGSARGNALQMRGINARILKAGHVRVGEPIRKL